jgi:hypothetical protein
MTALQNQKKLDVVAYSMKPDSVIKNGQKNNSGILEKIKSVSFKLLIAGLGVIGGLVGSGLSAVHAPILAKKIIVFQMGGGVLAEISGYMTAGALAEKIIYFGTAVGTVVLPSVFIVIVKATNKCMSKCSGKNTVNQC